MIVKIPHSFFLAPLRFQTTPPLTVGCEPGIAFFLFRPRLVNDCVACRLFPFVCKVELGSFWHHTKCCSSTFSDFCTTLAFFPFSTLSLIFAGAPQTGGVFRFDTVPFRFGDAPVLCIFLCRRGRQKPFLPRIPYFTALAPPTRSPPCFEDS